jgi:hypothetical protein
MPHPIPLPRTGTAARLFAARLFAAGLLAVGLAAAPARAQDTSASPPIAERRVALVVGNQSYSAAPLRNAVNDARAMARMLRDMGFEVQLKENLGQKGFIDALRGFGAAMREGGVGLFYYAGHGMQLKGRNFLIPVDAEIQSEDEVPFMSIDANQVLGKMEQARTRLNIVMLDACRNNPYAKTFRTTAAGLAQMDAPSGTLIAFATAPGGVAADGEGENSVYTKHLLAHLPEPGVPIEIALKRVREAVTRETNDKQIPWESSSLLGDFVFNPAASKVAAAAPAGTSDQLAVEIAFWNSVKDSKSAADFQAYLQQFPNGRFAVLARNRLQQLHAPATAAKPAGSPGATAQGGTAAAPSGTVQVAAAAPSRAVAPSTFIPESWPRIGDTWTYSMRSDGVRLGEVTVTIAQVSSDKIDDVVTTEQPQRSRAERSFRTYFDPNAGIKEVALPKYFFLSEFSPYLTAFIKLEKDREWVTGHSPMTWVMPGHSKIDGDWDFTLRVRGEERIKTPAGKFNALKIEARSDARGPARLLLTYWYAPEVKRIVKITRFQYHSDVRQEDEFELVRYKLN